MAERSPKRQRRSYSASPPPAHPDFKAAEQHPPQTPPPSVHMSPLWQSQSQSMPTTGSATFPTPQSQHTMGDNESDRGTESEHQTPMADHESAPQQTKDGDDDEEMQEAQHVALQQSQPTEQDDNEHRRTDHERQTASGGGRTTSPLPAAPRLYTMAVEPFEPPRPHATQNFIELYGLQGIQASVARRDAAGNKINKLRKSYENKVKNLGLEGRSKAQVGNAALQGLVDPGWDMDVGNGMTTWHARTSELPLSGLKIDDFLGKLDGALSLAPGHLPPKEHDHWKSILGLDGSGAKTTPSLNPSKPLHVSPGALHSRPESVPAVRNSAPASPGQLVRPERVGKKRRYDESSYTGYHEGYDDDGYSTGGLDDAGNRRGSGFKRQKVQQRKVGVHDGL